MLNENNLVSKSKTIIDLKKLGFEFARIESIRCLSIKNQSQKY